MQAFLWAPADSTLKICNWHPGSTGALCLSFVSWMSENFTFCLEKGTSCTHALEYDQNRVPMGWACKCLCLVVLMHQSASKGPVKGLRWPRGRQGYWAGRGAVLILGHLQIFGCLWTKRGICVLSPVNLHLYQRENRKGLGCLHLCLMWVPHVGDHSSQHPLCVCPVAVFMLSFTTGQTCKQESGRRVPGWGGWWLLQTSRNSFVASRICLSCEYSWD